MRSKRHYAIGLAVASVILAAALPAQGEPANGVPPQEGNQAADAPTARLEGLAPTPPVGIAEPEPPSLPTGAAATDTAAGYEDGPANPVVKPGYVLDFQDEFSGTELDSDTWMKAYLPQWSSDYAKTVSENQKVEDGVLTQWITAAQEGWSEQDLTKHGSEYHEVRSTAIQSYNQVYWHDFKGGGLNNYGIAGDPRYDFEGYTTQYGYFEVRAKKADVPEVSGEYNGGHQAFWLVGTDDKTAASKNSEIDFIETQYNEPDSWEINGYGWGDPNYINRWEGTNGGKKVPRGQPTKEYHTYGMEWTPDQLLFYYDNELFFTMDDAPNMPMGMIINLYTEAGSGHPNSIWPKQWYIDYVRVYKKATGYNEELKIAGLDGLQGGTQSEVTTVFQNWGTDPATNVEVRLPLPEGWTAKTKEADGNLFAEVGPGGKVTTTWLVAPKADFAGTITIKPEAVLARECSVYNVTTEARVTVLPPFGAEIAPEATTVTAISEVANQGSWTALAAYAIDGKTNTYWQSAWDSLPAYKPFPIWLRLELAEATEVTGIRYLARQDDARPRIQEYEVQVSATGEDGTWSTIKQGVLENSTAWQTITFPAVTAKFVRLVATKD
ncbi:MAG: discoidin domain-containing protein, partial [Bifidobacteriaceae bacterium]|nr:discoidin domain-containing protein [Bifidobacteriaceae bacterium]